MKSTKTFFLLKILYKELLTYTLQWSDNNACDILFDHIIDPQQTDVLLRCMSEKDFNISATEREIHFDAS